MKNVEWLRNNELWDFGVLIANFSEFHNFTKKLLLISIKSIKSYAKIIWAIGKF